MIKRRGRGMTTCLLRPNPRKYEVAKISQPWVPLSIILRDCSSLLCYYTIMTSSIGITHMARNIIVTPVAGQLFPIQHDIIRQGPKLENLLSLRRPDNFNLANHKQYQI